MRVRDRGYPTTLWNRAYLLLCLTILLAYTHQGLLTPTLPLYVADSGGSVLMAGFVLMAFSVTSFGLRPLAGYSTDRWGPASVLLFGTLLLAGSVLGFLAPILLGFFLVNAVRGLGWAAMNTAGYTVLSQVSPPTRRAEASGYYTLITTVAHAFPAAAALWLLASPVSSFGAVFILSAGAALLATLSGRFIAGPALEPRRAGSEKADGSLQGFDLAALVDRRLLLASLLSVCMTATGPGASAFLPLYAREMGVDNAGPYFVATGITSVLARLALARAMDRGGRGSWIALGFGLMVAGLGILRGASGLEVLVIGGVLYSLGTSIANPMLLALAIDLADPQRPGASMATFSASYQVGVAVGAPTAGALVEAFGYRGMYLGAITALALGLGLIAANWRKLSRRAQAREPRGEQAPSIA